MEIYDNKKNSLEKIDCENSGAKKLLVTEEELGGISAGYAIVNDPIYSLTQKESDALSAAGYKLKKTGSGNYRITDENGKMASPSEIATICKVVNKVSKTNNKTTGKTFWDWLSGNFS